MGVCRNGIQIFGIPQTNDYIILSDELPSTTICRKDFCEKLFGWGVNSNARKAPVQKPKAEEQKKKRKRRQSIFHVPTTSHRRYTTH